MKPSLAFAFAFVASFRSNSDEGEAYLRIFSFDNFPGFWIMLLPFLYGGLY